MAIILECMRLVQCQTVAALPMGVQVGQRSTPAAVTPFVISVTPVVLDGIFYTMKLYVNLLDDASVKGSTAHITHILIFPNTAS